MKKISTLLAVLATAAAAFAQPIFTGAALQPFIGQPINLMYSRYTGTTAAPVAAPPVFNGTTFNFTTYAWNAPSTYVISPILPASPYATHYETGYTDNISATKALTTYSLLTKIDPTSVKTVGWFVDSIYVSLTSITGGANDHYNIPQQAILYSQPIVTERFPMTVGTLINSAAPAIVQYNGTISVAAYGLTNAPFTRKLYISQRDSVVGWGNIQTIDQTNMPITTPFLETRRVTIRTDSFFLMGAPAPTALLTALGTTQGRIVLASRTGFFCESSPYPLGYISCTNTTFTAPTSASMLILPPPVATKEERNATAEWTVFPNPIRNNQITLNYTATTPVKFTMTDLLGRVVSTQTLPANLDNTATTTNIPANLTNGIYNLSLIGDGDLQKTWKINVLN